VLRTPWHDTMTQPGPRHDNQAVAGTLLATSSSVHYDAREEPPLNRSFKVDDQFLKPGNNSIGFLRLVLASMVVFEHTFALAHLPEPTHMAAKLAVDGFFFLSGMLVTQSFAHCRQALGDLASMSFAQRSLRTRKQGWPTFGRGRCESIPATGFVRSSPLL